MIKHAYQTVHGWNIKIDRGGWKIKQFFIIYRISNSVLWFIL
jgi:hypothetical protein